MGAKNMHNQLFYKKIAIHESTELGRSISLSAASPARTVSSLSSLLALKISLALLAPLLVFAALFLGCGDSSDFERAGRSDAGTATDQYNEPDASDGGLVGDDGLDPDVSTDAPTNPDDAGGANNGFPIDFEPSGSGSCSLPSNVSTTQATAASSPYGSTPANPQGGQCYLKITQMTSDGIVTVEFPSHMPINGTHLTFDVSFEDTNQVNSSIMFLVGLEDNDDMMAYVHNTLNMQAGGWYRVSVPVSTLLDMDPQTGDGALSPGVKRFKIKAFNSSVGTGQYDQVSELAFDNIKLTNDDQTSTLSTPSSSTDGDLDTDTDTETPDAGEDDAGDSPDAAATDETPGDAAGEDVDPVGVGNIEGFPIDFEAANPEDCELPENVTAIDAEIESAPYEDDPLPAQNPNGGNCFLRVNQMTSDGSMTIEFPDYVSLAGNFLSFDFSFGDANEIGAAIMFLIGLADDDDVLAYVVNTLEMQPDITRRISIPLDGLLDMDPETGDGDLPDGAKRFQIKAFNSSVGEGPYDQVSQLNFDNFEVTEEDETGEL